MQSTPAHRLLSPAIAAIAVLAGTIHAQSNYGVGTPGSGGLTPTISCSQPWMGNAGFGVNVAAALGGSTAWLAVSTAPATNTLNGVVTLVDLAPSRLFLLQPLVLPGPAGTPGVGAGTFPYPLSFAPIPALAGLTLHAQVGIDEGNGSWAASPGLNITLVMPPRILVGTSVGGAPDPFYVIDPTTPTLPVTNMTAPTMTPTGPAFNDNCRGAEFAHNGRRAYVAQVFGDVVRELNLDTNPPTWGNLCSTNGPNFGIGVDHGNNLTYTLDSAQPQSQELIAIDSDLGSGTYGVVMATTVGLSAWGGYMERWAMSPDKTQAAILLHSTGRLLFIDTVPTSPTYMTVTSMTPMNPAGISSALSNAVTFTADSQQVLVGNYNGSASEISRFHIPSASWIDHNPSMPGTQPIGALSSPPVAVPTGIWEIETAPNGTFAVVTGWDGVGAMMMLDLDPANPFAWGVTPITSPFILGGTLSGAWCAAVSPDSTRIATTANGRLLIFDSLLGTLVGDVPLPVTTNVRAVTWQH